MAAAAAAAAAAMENEVPDLLLGIESIDPDLVERLMEGFLAPHAFDEGERGEYAHTALLAPGAYGSANEMDMLWECPRAEEPAPLLDQTRPPEAMAAAFTDPDELAYAVHMMRSGSRDTEGTLLAGFHDGGGGQLMLPSFGGFPQYQEQQQQQQQQQQQPPPPPPRGSRTVKRPKHAPRGTEESAVVDVGPYTMEEAFADMHLMLRPEAADADPAEVRRKREEMRGIAERWRAGWRQPLCRPDPPACDSRCAGTAAWAHLHHEHPVFGCHLHGTVHVCADEAYGGDGCLWLRSGTADGITCMVSGLDKGVAVVPADPGMNNVAYHNSARMGADADMAALMGFGGGANGDGRWRREALGSRQTRGYGIVSREVSALMTSDRPARSRRSSHQQRQQQQQQHSSDDEVASPLSHGGGAGTKRKAEGAPDHHSGDDDGTPRPAAVPRYDRQYDAAAETAALEDTNKKKKKNSKKKKKRKNDGEQDDGRGAARETTDAARPMRAFPYIRHVDGLLDDVLWSKAGRLSYNAMVMETRMKRGTDRFVKAARAARAAGAPLPTWCEIEAMMESAAGAGGPDTVHVPAEKCHACDGYYANVIIRAWGLMAELHRALRARRETPSWELRATPSAYKQFALAMLYTMAEGHKADGRTIVHRDPWLKLVLPQQTHIHRFNNEAENRLYRCNDITTGDKHVKPFLGALIREHAREHPERAHELARRALYQNVTQQYMQLQHLGSHRHHGGDDGYGGDDADPASQAASARLAHALGHVLEAKSEEPMYPYQPQQQQQQSASPPLPSDDGTLADA